MTTGSLAGVRLHGRRAPSVLLVLAAAGTAALSTSPMSGVQRVAGAPPSTAVSLPVTAVDDMALRPRWSPRPDALVPLSLPEVINHGDRSKPLVALTFDSNMTATMLRDLNTGRVVRFVNDRVISELREKHVPATFFLSGLWVERYPDVAASLASDPLFEVGSHSYAHLGFRDHCYDLGHIDLARAAADVEHSESVLDRIAPQHTRYFRFPGGCYDAKSLAAIRAAHVQVVQYDVASGDAFGMNPTWMVANTLASVRNGSIVVMHITGGNRAPFTDRALPLIVEGLRTRGFTLVTLSQLISAGPVA
jgi:peptidoglycan/xylan/chitin deacetylase (PgdA/CDA1 family)